MSQIKLKLHQHHQVAEWYERAYRDVFGEVDSLPHQIDCLYIAYVDGNPAAFGSYALADNEAAAYFNSCGVLSEYRGLGLQHALIKKRLGHAYASGLERAYTYTHAANVRSNNNLIKTGWRMFVPAHWSGRAVNYLEVGKPWLYWVRKTSGKVRDSERDKATRTVSK